MLLNEEDVVRYLQVEGEHEKRIDDVRDGFDWNEPVYFTDLEEGETLYQFVRRHGNLGNWFALRGARMEDLAIFSGHSGRVLKKVRIVYPCRVVEGSARPQSRHWAWAGGGPGGGTQLFMPSRFILPCVAIAPGDVRHA